MAMRGGMARHGGKNKQKQWLGGFCAAAWRAPLCGMADAALRHGAGRTPPMEKLTPPMEKLTPPMEKLTAAVLSPARA
jgi:hypothetical protein